MNDAGQRHGRDQRHEHRTDEQSQRRSGARRDVCISVQSAQGAPDSPQQNAIKQPKERRKRQSHPERFLVDIALEFFTMRFPRGKERMNPTHLLWVCIPVVIPLKERKRNRAEDLPPKERDDHANHGPRQRIPKMAVQKQDQPRYQEAPDGPQENPPTGRRLFDVADIATVARASRMRWFGIHGHPRLRPISLGRAQSQESWPNATRKPPASIINVLGFYEQAEAFA